MQPMPPYEITSRTPSSPPPQTPVVVVDFLMFADDGPQGFSLNSTGMELLARLHSLGVTLMAMCGPSPLTAPEFYAGLEELGVADIFEAGVIAWPAWVGDRGLDLIHPAATRVLKTIVSRWSQILVVSGAGATSPATLRTMHLLGVTSPSAYGRYLDTVCNGDRSRVTIEGTVVYAEGERLRVPQGRLDQMRLRYVDVAWLAQQGDDPLEAVTADILRQLGLG